MGLAVCMFHSDILSSVDVDSDLQLYNYTSKFWISLDMILLTFAILKALFLCHEVIRIPITAPVMKDHTVLALRVIAISGHHGTTVTTLLRKLTVIFRVPCISKLNREHEYTLHFYLLNGKYCSIYA